MRLRKQFPQRNYLLDVRFFIEVAQCVDVGAVEPNGTFLKYLWDRGLLAVRGGC